MTLMARTLELLRQITDIWLRLKALQEKLRPITARLAAGVADPALGRL